MIIDYIALVLCLWGLVVVLYILTFFIQQFLNFSDKTAKNVICVGSIVILIFGIIKSFLIGVNYYG